MVVLCVYTDQGRQLPCFSCGMEGTCEGGLSGPVCSLRVGALALYGVGGGRCHRPGEVQRRLGCPGSSGVCRLVSLAFMSVMLVFPGGHPMPVVSPALVEHSVSLRLSHTC